MREMGLSMILCRRDGASGFCASRRKNHSYSGVDRRQFDCRNARIMRVRSARTVTSRVGALVSGAGFCAVGVR